jgi:hypothetical protein
MQRLFAIFLGWALLGSALGAALVPGKAFERFITIWLENQVSYLTQLGRRWLHTTWTYPAIDNAP